MTESPDAVSVFVVRCFYRHGWVEYEVGASDSEHARALMEKWCKSKDGKARSASLREDAIGEWREAHKDYRELREMGTSAAELSKPPAKAPGMIEFELGVESVREHDSDPDYDVEAGEIEEFNDHGGWEWNVDPSRLEVKSEAQSAAKSSFRLQEEKPELSNAEAIGCLSVLLFLAMVVLWWLL